MIYNARETLIKRGTSDAKVLISVRGIRFFDVTNRWNGGLANRGITLAFRPLRNGGPCRHRDRGMIDRRCGRGWAQRIDTDYVWATGKFRPNSSCRFACRWSRTSLIDRTRRCGQRQRPRWANGSPRTQTFFQKPVHGDEGAVLIGPRTNAGW